MKEEQKTEATKQSNALRLELKAWEKKFAAENEGRKASREDIKRNPDIGTALYTGLFKHANLVQHKSIKTITG